MKKFIILTRGRTGSTIICDVLGRVKGITCGQELFKPLNTIDFNIDNVMLAFGDERKVNLIDKMVAKFPIWYKDCGCKKLPYYIFKKILPNSLLSNYYDYLAMNNDDTLGVGFKVLSNHLGNTWKIISEGLSLLVDEKISVLYLQRCDIEREALSNALAQARNIFNVKKGDVSIDITTKTYVDIDVLKNEIAYINDTKINMLKLLNDSKVDYQECYFEDFLENRECFLLDILTFIGIKEPNILLKMSDITNDGFIKVTPEDLSEIIENYEEVMMVL